MAICPARPNVVQPVISGGGSFTPPVEKPPEVKAPIEKPPVPTPEVKKVEKPAEVAPVKVVEKPVAAVVVKPEVKTPEVPHKEVNEVNNVKPEVPAVAGGVGNDELPSPGPAVDKKTPNKPKGK